MPTFTGTLVAKGEKYVPTPEQKAASEARRAAQAAAKEGKRHVVIPGTVKRLPLRTHLNRNQVLNAGLSLGAAGLLGREVTKLDDRDRRTLLGAGAGLAAADAASVIGGQSAKAVLMRRRAARGETPHQQETWGAHKQKHGLKAGEEPTGHTPAKTKHKIFTQYPKDLPDWKGQRALGWKNSARGTAAILGGGALAGGAMGRRREVAKGGLGFALAGGATGSAGLLTASRRKDSQQKEAAREALGATAGGWAAQGAYQGAGYAAKHRAQRKYAYGSSGQGRQAFLTNPDGSKSFRTKSQSDKRIKAAEKQTGTRRGTPEFDRRYPKTLPEWKTHRVLGLTHRGKIGTAVGGTLTAAGTYGGAELASGQKKPFQREPVRKAERLYGYQERKRNYGRTAQLGAGVALGAYGASRLPVGQHVARGVKFAEARGYGPQAQKAAGHLRTGRNQVRRVTGQAEDVLRGRVPGLGTALDVIPRKMRPGLATAGGALLAARAVPTHDVRFVPTGRF